MLVNITEHLELSAGTAAVWSLLRDTARLGALIPGVESVSPLEPGEAGQERYAGVVTEKVGPFKVTLNLEVEFSEIVDQSILKGSVRGQDKMKLSRATGSIAVALSKLSDTTTAMQFDVSVEVLGKLATLGSTVIRRRVNELFAEFARRFQAAVEVSPA